MSESESAPARSGPQDVEGAERILEHVDGQERDQQAKAARAESTRQRLLRAKEQREQTAEPFEYTFEQASGDADARLDELLVGETFEFRPFPKQVKNAIQEVALKYRTVNEDDDDVPDDVARRVDEANDMIRDALAEFSTDPELDKAFWSEMTDLEDRQIMAGQLIARQGK